MRRVIIESPFAGPDQATIDYNVSYLRACMRDCLLRGESPYASHALYTQPGVLDDKMPEERKLGIEAGFEWKAVADATIVYTDLGITAGMKKGISNAEARADHIIEYRKLGGKWADPRDTIRMDTPCWWFGVWPGNGSGHGLYTISGRSAYDALPFNYERLDGGYAPKQNSAYGITFKYEHSEETVRRKVEYNCEELPQGQFLRHRIEDITFISFWDRSHGDKRPGCNSAYLVRGDHTSEQMVKWLGRHFPKQAHDLYKAGVTLVEVKATY